MSEKNIEYITKSDSKFAPTFGQTSFITRYKF